ncbi:MAG: ribbon-helix-helix protein, CopG family [Nevskiaceae bacterium]|nr:MAG: ribbon-helix-helix protein, CopG family [Nevskiaceae bacterium]TBR73531.1 MAG: ribbon-helix-helix protein, CopG family [Nevskiaceae bacterium]
MATLTIRVDPELSADLEQIAAQRHQNKSELARQFIRGSLAREKLRLSQEELGPQARATGWLTEDDILRDVS